MKLKAPLVKEVVDTQTGENYNIRLYEEETNDYNEAEIKFDLFTNDSFIKNVPMFSGNIPLDSTEKRYINAVNNIIESYKNAIKNQNQYRELTIVARNSFLDWDGQL